MRLKVLLFLVLMFCAIPARASTPLTASDTGACTTAGACLTIPINNNLATSGFSISGTFSATIQFEGCIDACGTAASWVAVSAYPTNSTTAVTSATAAGTWRIVISGLTQIRMRVSTYVSGTVNASITTSTGSASVTGGGGGGGVSSFSGDGTLLGNSASTGAVTASIKTAIANSLWGNATNSTAAPGYTANPVVASLTTAGSGAGANASAAGVDSCAAIQANLLSLFSVNSDCWEANPTIATSFHRVGASAAYTGFLFFTNTTGTMQESSVSSSAVCQPGSFAAQTDGATVTWAIGSAICANASLLFTAHSGSRTLALTGLVNGGSYVLEAKQDATGGEGLTLGSGCTWKVSGGGSGAITLSTGANAIDMLAFTYDGTNCYLNFNKNFN